MVCGCCTCQHPETHNLIGISPQGFNEHHLIINSHKVITSPSLHCLFLDVSPLLTVCRLGPHQIMRADLLAAERCLIWENGGDRWKPDKHKVLARRRLLKWFVRNYVMEHDRSLIGGCDHMLQATAGLCSPLLGVICQTLHESTCGFWIIHYYRMCIKKLLSGFYLISNWNCSWTCLGFQGSLNRSSYT